MSSPPAFCGRCGRPLAEARARARAEHSACAEALRLEPPRYCAACRRRMVVQVTPDGWSARCVEHGTVRQSTWAS